MGGNALMISTQRADQETFFKIQGHVCGLLPLFFSGSKIAAIPAYKEKATFGDLDILISKSLIHKQPDWVDQLIEFLKKNFGTTEFFKNGDVLSFDYHQPDTGFVFQVDLIFISEDRFEYALSYFSYNDLGNLIGRTAHKAGLAHKHDGLVYYVRDGDYLADEILLTTDYKKALVFLGYDPTVFEKGFVSLEDIFKYVAGSKYFNADIFLLENRNTIAKARDKKRKTYMEFLKWCAAHPELPKFTYPAEKSAWLPVIAKEFPEFEQALAKVWEKVNNNRAAKLKFNGEAVSKITGFKEKPLGAFIQSFKRQFESESEFQSWILASSQEEIEEKIKGHLLIFK